MRKVTAAVIGTAFMADACGGAAHAADDRMVVEVPPDIADSVRAEMRQHMDTLDDLMAALAMGSFDEAADIALSRMSFGHQMWQRMADAGASPEEIEAVRRQLRDAGIGPGAGRGQSAGLGRGHGRYMPDDFRAMGMVFHEAAEEFAVVARAAGDPPNVEDYEAVLGALQFVTSTCRGCHATWRFD